jgi:hypothetical protein
MALPGSHVSRYAFMLSVWALAFGKRSSNAARSAVSFFFIWKIRLILCKVSEEKANPIWFLV